ncbi:hypothetical protein F5141DRAFT_1262768 [Pisolithus sp. B1]|nr:hypothetical protein F5141DRAFT_1262768 [Pisolithus sp. B1]
MAVVNDCSVVDDCRVAGGTTVGVLSSIGMVVPVTDDATISAAEAVDHSAAGSTAVGVLSSTVIAVLVMDNLSATGSMTTFQEQQCILRQQYEDLHHVALQDVVQDFQTQKETLSEVGTVLQRRETKLASLHDELEALITEADSYKRLEIQSQMEKMSTAWVANLEACMQEEVMSLRESLQTGTPLLDAIKRIRRSQGISMCTHLIGVAVNVQDDIGTGGPSAERHMNPVEEDEPSGGSGSMVPISAMVEAVTKGVEAALRNNEEVRLEKQCKPAVHQDFILAEVCHLFKEKLGITQDIDFITHHPATAEDVHCEDENWPVKRSDNYIMEILWEHYKQLQTVWRNAQPKLLEIESPLMEEIFIRGNSRSTRYKRLLNKQLLSLLKSYWIQQMDNLPKLTHNGHNWTTYTSLVLCAISDEGLMGFLVGSERRPTHPTQLEGHDEVAAWRAADQLWTQRNVMVNYTIVCGIPDTIFGFMLHLKSPLEKWSYLENRFGSIPRPESWLVAEEAMQRSDSNAAAETAQDTHSSNNELETSPGGHEDSVDSPNDCTETKSGYLTPETKVIDTRHEEPHLLEVEDRAADSKQPDKGTDTVDAPDKDSQCADDKVEDRQELPMTSSEALETQGNLPFTTSERAKTRTGHRKPENEVVDTQQVVDVLPMFEVGSTGQTWHGKHVKELEAPDERYHSEVLKPAGNPTRQAGGHSMQGRPQIPSEENQRTGTNSEMIANVPDPPGTPTKLPTPQVESSMLRKWPSAQARSAMNTEFEYTRRSRK